MAVATTSWTLDILVLIIFLLFVGVYRFLTRNHDLWKNSGVLQVPPNFLFGNIAPCLFGRQRPDEFFLEIYRRAEGGKMIGFYVFDKPYLLLRDPELIKNVLVKDFNNFPNRLLSTSDDDKLGKNNVFLTKTPQWNHIRRKISPFFNSVRLEKRFDKVLEICQDFNEYLDSLGIDDKVGKPLHFKEMCASFVTDIIGKTAFSMNFNSLKNPEAEFRYYGKAIFRSDFKRYLQLISMFLIPSMQPLIRPKFFDEEGSRFLRRVFWGIIDERVRSRIQTSDLIDILIEMKENQEIDGHNVPGLGDETFISQASGIFTAGFITASSTLAFALYELAIRPEIQKKLRDEVMSGLQETNGKVTYELVTSLSYLHMICQETVRLHPVVPWIDRVCESRYTFSGTDVTIEKGIPVILPTRCLHLDPNHFPDPEDFKPERFSKENRETIAPFTYFPFGGGPRGCLGSKLGLVQVKTGLITIISQYELSPCAITVPKNLRLETLNVFLHPLDELRLNFKKLSR